MFYSGTIKRQEIQLKSNFKNSEL